MNRVENRLKGKELEDFNKVDVFLKLMGYKLNHIRGYNGCIFISYQYYYFNNIDKLIITFMVNKEKKKLNCILLNSTWLRSKPSDYRSEKRVKDLEELYEHLLDLLS